MATQWLARRTPDRREATRPSQLGPRVLASTFAARGQWVTGRSSITATAASCWRAVALPGNDHFCRCLYVYWREAMSTLNCGFSSDFDSGGYRVRDDCSYAFTRFLTAWL